jgi:uncharacterized protein (DUF2336 family)
MGGTTTMSDATETSEELDLLLQMARDKTSSGRQALMSAVSDLFFNENNVLSDRERALMSDILRQIIHDVEMSVRRELADRLITSGHAPHDLVLALANDDIEVAHPILIASDILHDTDLVEIIQHRTMQHQLAISMRKNLSESVTDALVETGNQDFIEAMLKNTDAQVSQTTMEYLVEQAKRVDTYQNPLLRRPDLDPDLAKRMYWWVSAALRQHIIDHFEIDPTELDATIETTVKNVMTNDSVTIADKHMELAEKLQSEGKITADLMVKVLRQGEVPLFEAMFSKRSGLRPRLLRRLMFEQGGEALAVACKGIDIPKSDFATIFMLTRKARSGSGVMNPRELTRVLALYDRVRPEAASAMVGRWQRDSDFLNAVRVLKDNGGLEAEANERRIAGDRRSTSGT